MLILSSIADIIARTVSVHRKKLRHTPVRGKEGLLVVVVVVLVVVVAVVVAGFRVGRPPPPPPTGEPART